MTGSVVLDVVIGLAFMYLLYSLFATIIMEIIANWLSLRARNLEYSIRRMLCDERRSKFYNLDWASKIMSFFMGFCQRFIGIKRGRDLFKLDNQDLFSSFYNASSIKFLSHGGLFTKPSYLTANNFSKALMDSLKKGQKGKSTFQKIKNGIDTITRNPETKAYIQSLLDDANNDLEKFKILVENWFEDTQERSIGWYKRTNQTWLLFIGFVIAVFLNADTLKIVNKLSTDPDARQQLVEMAIASADINEKRIKELEKFQISSDSNKTEKDSLLRAKIDTLKAMSNLVQNDINKAQGLLSIDWELPKNLAVYFKKPIQDSTSKSVIMERDVIVEYDDGSEEINKKLFIVADTAGLDWEIFIRSIPEKIKEEDMKSGLRVNQSYYKLAYVFKNDQLAGWGYFNPMNYLKFENLWGYLITALAISLGAPFWFDLLNKLIKLRGSVQQPARTQASTKKTNSNQEILDVKA